MAPYHGHRQNFKNNLERCFNCRLSLFTWPSASLHIHPCTSNLAGMLPILRRYANNESYQRALEDFRQALKMDPRHQNAINYAVQTLLAYARE